MKANLITRDGYEALKKELDYLWREKRPDTTRKVTWAASLGDRSENADYQYGKRRLREIDRRIRFLTKRLDLAEVVDPAHDSGCFHLCQFSFNVVLLALVFENRASLSKEQAGRFLTKK